MKKLYDEIMALKKPNKYFQSDNENGYIDGFNDSLIEAAELVKKYQREIEEAFDKELLKTQVD